MCFCHRRVQLKAVRAVPRVQHHANRVTSCCFVFFGFLTLSSLKEHHHQNKNERERVKDPAQARRQTFYRRIKQNQDYKNIINIWVCSPRCHFHYECRNENGAERNKNEKKILFYNDNNNCFDEWKLKRCRVRCKCAIRHGYDMVFFFLRLFRCWSLFVNGTASGPFAFLGRKKEYDMVVSSFCFVFIVLRVLCEPLLCGWWT